MVRVINPRENSWVRGGQQIVETAQIFAQARMKAKEKQDNNFQELITLMESGDETEISNKLTMLQGMPDKARRRMYGKRLEELGGVEALQNYGEKRDRTSGDLTREDTARLTKEQANQAEAKTPAVESEAKLNIKKNRIESRALSATQIANRNNIQQNEYITDAEGNKRNLTREEADAYVFGSDEEFAAVADQIEYQSDNTRKIHALAADIKSSFGDVSDMEAMVQARNIVLHYPMEMSRLKYENAMDEKSLLALKIQIAKAELAATNTKRNAAGITASQTNTIENEIHEAATDFVGNYIGAANTTGSKQKESFWTKVNPMRSPKIITVETDVEGQPIPWSALIALANPIDPTNAALLSHYGLPPIPRNEFGNPNMAEALLAQIEAKIGMQIEGFEFAVDGEQVTVTRGEFLADLSSTHKKIADKYVQLGKISPATGVSEKKPIGTISANNKAANDDTTTDAEINLIRNALTSLGVMSDDLEAAIAEEASLIELQRIAEEQEGMQNSVMHDEWINQRGDDLGTDNLDLDMGD